MNELAFPLLTAAVAIPLLAAFLTRRASSSPDHTRRAGVVGAAISLALSLEACRQVFTAGGAVLVESLLGTDVRLFAVDPLSSVLMAIYCAVVLITIVLAPRRDSQSNGVAANLIVLASTLACYAADNPLTLLIGFTGSILPLAFGTINEHPYPGSRTRNFAQPVLIGSVVSLVIAFAIMTGASHGLGITASFSAPQGDVGTSSQARIAFGFLILAACLRKGIFPIHGWIVNAFDRGPLLPVALLVNGHLGAYLIARVAIPHFPQLSRKMLPVVGDLALATALYTAVLAVAERKPRRLLALIFASQASFILSGLQSSNLQGVTGGLTHWMVVAVSTTGLIAVYRVMEARVFGLASATDFSGLAAKAPRLACFFAICGLALVGLPGTLGFCAEDLLFHGALETHPQLGVVLPIATALSAVNIFRVFASLFLGKRGTLVPDVPDALPRERWALSACVVFLIAGGLLPGSVIGWRTTAAHALADVVEEHPAPDNGARAIAKGGMDPVASRGYGSD